MSHLAGILKLTDLALNLAYFNMCISFVIQQLLSEIERKLKESQPEEQRRSKQIPIQEIDMEHSTSDQGTEQTGGKFAVPP